MKMIRTPKNFTYKPNRSSYVGYIHTIAKQITGIVLLSYFTVISHISNKCIWYLKFCQSFGEITHINRPINTQSLPLSRGLSF